MHNKMNWTRDMVLKLYPINSYFQPMLCCEKSEVSLYIFPSVWVISDPRSHSGKKAGRAFRLGKGVQLDTSVCIFVSILIISSQQISFVLLPKKTVNQVDSDWEKLFWMKAVRRTKKWTKPADDVRSCFTVQLANNLQHCTVSATPLSVLERCQLHFRTHQFCARLIDQQLKSKDALFLLSVRVSIYSSACPSN